MTERVVRNPLRRRPAPVRPISRAPLAFHAGLPGYQRTPLVDAEPLARALGLERVLVKDESSRLGLPAFKMLGASWACHRALAEHTGPAPEALTAATDGNHGRAVARMAKLRGLRARIFVPEGTAAARIAAIESEGATATVVPGTYDDAVARSAAEASDRCLVISDTSWPGYEVVPDWVIDGYSTIFWEIGDELAERRIPPPQVVFAPIGVGALAAAVARHYRSADGSSAGDDVRLVGVEPVGAECMLASIEAGDPVTIEGPHDSIMVGLNCGTPSPVAWPEVSAAFDWFCSVADVRAEDAMRELAAIGLVAGETGAAALAGLHAMLDHSAAGLTGTSVLLLMTEGATDPANYERIVGRRPP